MYAKDYPPTEVLYFCSVLWRKDLMTQDELTEVLTRQMGIGTWVGSQSNTMTNYYGHEMGDQDQLVRRWFLASEKAPRSQLVSRKEWAYSWEGQNLSRDGKRVVNLDPGFCALEQMVLATMKPYGHRLWLGGKVYGELTYQFQQGHYHPLPWTYPDYSMPEVIKLFEDLRCLLKGKGELGRR